MTLQPKTRFLQDPVSVKRHSDLFGSQEMQTWLMIAFAEYSLNLPSSRGAVDSMDSNSRRDGAREFMHLLMNLSTQTPPRPPLSDNLPHLT